MMIAMLVAGLGCLLAGLLAIGFGIPVNEFSFGNTLILSGAIAACAGLIILSLWVVVRELRRIAERLGEGAALNPNGGVQAAAKLPRLNTPDGSMAGGERAAATESGEHFSPSSGVSRPDEAAAHVRSRDEADVSPTAKPRRNLLFSSTSRRERERTRLADLPAAAEPPSMPAAAPAPDTEDVAPPTFDEARRQSGRSRSADASSQWRGGRTPPTFSEPVAARPPRAEDTEVQPAVTVLKSGIVDRMAYSLYSDGSIEAQMPEGMMRFASIDELRAHLDQRP
ncbi:MAG TPA: DUF308 domain-containing protein [Bradyrhizobium sp.]|nr:DUF308 domain-containing protein [Bradyrhizobium sp.]